MRLKRTVPTVVAQQYDSGFRPEVEPVTSYVLLLNHSTRLTRTNVDDAKEHNTDRLTEAVYNLHTTTHVTNQDDGVAKSLKTSLA